MIIDEILYAERLFRERHRNESPQRLTLSDEYYEKLCQELGVEYVDVFHGMEIEVTDDVDTLLIEELDYLMDYEDEYE
jgi:hypothetical protein